MLIQKLEPFDFVEDSGLHSKMIGQAANVSEDHEAIFLTVNLFLFGIVMSNNKNESKLYNEYDEHFLYDFVISHSVEIYF